MSSVSWEDVESLMEQMECESAAERRDAISQLQSISQKCEKALLPLRNARRFLHSLRRRMNDSNEKVSRASLRLICDIIPVLGDNVELILTLIIPHAIKCLAATSGDLHQKQSKSSSGGGSAMDILWEYARCSDDMIGVSDALINMGMIHEDDAVREASVLAMKEILSSQCDDDRMYAQIDYQELLRVLVSLLEDDDAAVVVASEETLGAFKGYCKEFDNFAKRLSKRDRFLLHDHFEYISRFIPSPRLDDAEEEEQEEYDSTDEDDDDAVPFEKSSTGVAKSSVVVPAIQESPLDSSGSYNRNASDDRDDSSSSDSDAPPVMEEERVTTSGGGGPQERKSRDTTPRKVTPRQETFGFIPASIVRDVTDTSDDQKRIKACYNFLQLTSNVEDPKQISSIHANRPELIEFITKLISDRNFQVVALALDVLRNVMNVIGSVVRAHLPIIIPVLLEKLGDGKAKIRHGSIAAFSVLMQYLSNASLFLSLKGSFNHSNWRIREEGIKLLILGMLKKPEQLIPLDQMLPELVQLLCDPNSKVQHATWEVCAILQTKSYADTDILGELKRSEMSTGNSIIDYTHLKRRLRSDSLPFITPDGLVECTYDERQHSNEKEEVDSDEGYESGAKVVPHSNKQNNHDFQEKDKTRVEKDSIAPQNNIFAYRSEVPSAHIETQELGYDGKDSHKQIGTYETANYRSKKSLTIDAEVVQRSDKYVFELSEQTPNKESSSYDHKEEYLVDSRSEEEKHRGGGSDASRRNELQYSEKETPVKDKVRLWLPESNTPTAVISPIVVDSKKESFYSPVNEAFKPSRRSKPGAAPGGAGFSKSAGVSHSSPMASPIVRTTETAPSEHIANRLTALKQRRSRSRRAITASQDPGASEQISSPRTPMEKGSYDLDGDRTNNIVVGTSSNVTVQKRVSKNAFVDSQEEVSHGFEQHPSERPIKPMQNSEEIYGNSELSAGDRPIRPMRDSTLAEYQFDSVPMGQSPKTDYGMGAYPDEYAEVSTPSSGKKFVSKATQKRRERESRLQKDPSYEDSPGKGFSSPKKTTPKYKSAFESKNKFGDASSPKIGKQDSIVYVETEDLQPVSNPGKEMSKLGAALKDSDWEANFSGLEMLRRLATHHDDVVAPKIHAIVKDTLKQVNNLRSSVAKNAMLAIESLFQGLARSMDPEVEAVMPHLIKRSSDTNAFLSEVAENVLQTIVQNASSSRIFASLVPLQSSKNSAIRYQVAKAIDRTIRKMSHRFSNYRDADQVLSQIGKFLMDSHADARNISKETIGFIVSSGCIDLSRLKRSIPAKAYSKVEQIISSTDTTYVLNSARGSSSTPKATSSSSRPKRNKVKRGAQYDQGSDMSALGDRIPMIQVKLQSSNWRERNDGLEELKHMILTNSDSHARSRHIVPVFDSLNALLEDGNMKVNVAALEAVIEIIPAFGNSLDQVLSNFIPALTGNLASSNRQASSLTQDAVDVLCENVSAKMLCVHFVDTIRNGNSRTKPLMVNALERIVDDLYDSRSALLSRHVLPLTFSLLGERKTDMREASKCLLRHLYSIMGSQLLNHTTQLSEGKQEKIASILRI